MPEYKNTARLQEKTLLSELIEKWPDIVNKRERFGDWEIDTVNRLRVKNNQALLTLTERKIRYEVIIKIEGEDSNPLKEAAGKHFELRNTLGILVERDSSTILDSMSAPY